MRNLFAILGILIVTISFAQNGEVRGIIYEKETGVPVDFANVYIKETLQGAVTDENGFFTISQIKPGTYTLFCSYIGYDSASVKVVVEKDQVTHQNLYLVKAERLLEEFTVSAEAQEKKEDVQIGKTKITIKEMEKLVTLGGEPDLVQSLQVLPGVYSSGDQGGQLYVRGGSPVMNKVLMDGMTIYQPFHSIGLFSVFDADVIRSADVYSAGFGAEYGGRISAIVDVRTREGNKTRLSGKVAVNPFTSKVLLEGPLKKYTEGGGSTSFIFSYKNSYLAQSASVFYPYVESNRLPYTFHDLYGKLSFVGSNGSKLDLFGFNYRDAVNFQGVTSYNWNSYGFGGKFVVLPDESKTKIDGFFSYSDYTMKQEEVSTTPRNSGINNFNIGLNFDYMMGKNRFVYGTEITGFGTEYQLYNVNGRRVDQEDFNTELSAYGTYKYVKPRLVIEAGMRIQYYASFSESFLEPRLAIKYNVNSKFRLKAAGGLYSQNLISATSDRDVVNLFYGYLASPDNLPKEFDGKSITSRLQKAWHAVGGFEWDLGKYTDLNIEGYYKNFFQLTNTNRDKIFEDNSANASRPDYLKKDYIIEKGEAYGVDTRVKFEKGRLYIWAVYSLTYVTRDDGIRKYYPQFDRRHNANLVVSYALDKKRTWDFNLRYNFGTGFPFTQTSSFYELIYLGKDLSQNYAKSNGDIGIIYSDINQGRLPNFHRVDISLQKTFKLSKHSELKLNAGCINVLNRANMFYFDRVSYERVDQLPILPTIGANWSF